MASANSQGPSSRVELTCIDLLSAHPCVSAEVAEMSGNCPILRELSRRHRMHCGISARVGGSSWDMGAKSEGTVKIWVARTGSLKKGMPLPWVTGKPVWAGFLPLG